MPGLLVLQEIIQNERKHLQEEKLAMIGGKLEKGSVILDQENGENTTKLLMEALEQILVKSFESKEMKKNGQMEGRLQELIELAKQLSQIRMENFGKIDQAVKQLGLSEGAQNIRDPIEQQELEEAERRRAENANQIAVLLAEIDELKRKIMSSGMILGGIGNNGAANEIYIYSSESQVWKQSYVSLPVMSFDFGAAIHNDELYIFDCNDFTGKNQIASYKLGENNEWNKLANMNEGRRYIKKSTIIFNEEIWVIGGYNRKQERTLESVEKYNSKTNTWTLMAELNHARRDCSAAVIEGKIYVAGGQDNEKNLLKSVEVYDPDKNRWEIFCDLPFELRDHCALVDGTNLIIIGGEKTGGKKSKEVLKMDISNPTNNWENLPDLIRDQSSHGAVKTGEGYMVFDGDFAEIFDNRENKWENVPSLVSQIHKNIYVFTSIQLSKKQEELFLQRFC